MSEAPRAAIRIWRIEVLLLLAFAAFMLLMGTGAIVIGSVAGAWTYPTIRPATMALALFALTAAVFAAVLFEFGWRLVDRRPALVVAVTIVVTFLFHLAVRGLYPLPMGAIVESQICTSFHSVALVFEPADFLRRYIELTPVLPVHAHNNLPGKVLLYDLMHVFTTDPQGLAVIIVALSDLGGILVYALATQWFASRRVALAALLFYLLFPARIAFFPILNVISPIPILASLLLLTVFLKRGHAAWLWVLGVALYGVTLFDPMTLGLGVVFVGLIAHHLARGSLAPDALWKLVAYPVAGYLATWIALRIWPGFDLFAAFRYALIEIMKFNVDAQRPYGVWFWPNIEEFLITAGVLVSLVLIAGFAQIAAETWRKARAAGARVALREALARPGPAIVLTVVANVAILMVMNIARGEIGRQFTFLLVAFEIAAAWLAVERYGRVATLIVVASLAFQTVYTVAMVGFLIC